MGFVALMSLSLVSISCEKEDDDNNTPAPTPTFGNMTLEFEHVYGADAFVIPSATFVNGSGESVSFSTLNYYVTNIVLTKADGSTWSEEESYHLIKVGAQSSVEIELENVPSGDYKAIEYTIGVDSLRNVSGAQTGALSPAEQMFWSWNSGYIFLKAEGQESGGQAFTYHIGGFRNSNGTNALQQINLAFGSMAATVSPNATPVVHQSVNVAEFFDGHDPLSILTTPTVTMPGMMAVMISENYHHMFEFEHVHN